MARRPAAIVTGSALLALALAGASAGATVAAPPPAALTTVESSAEDIVDDALAGNRPDVVAGAARLRAEADREAAPALRRGGVRPAEVALLEKRAARVAAVARSGRFVTVALSANAVSQLMPGLYGHFRNRVPPTILKLDWLDREAQLRSLARQPAAVASAVAELRRTWPLVRRKVVAAGGADEARAYDRHVAALHRLDPADGARVQEEASRGLELVDDLENVFSS